MEQQPITFSLQNSLAELDRLSEMLEMIGERWKLPAKITLQINLALDELFTNVVSYGLEDETNQKINFTLVHQGDAISIVVSDKGRQFDPTQAVDPDLELPLDEQQIGGLGIFLMRQYTDKIDYKREKGQNIITLTKTI